MIRLIASDLDGTLLEPKDHLPDGVFDLIRAFREKGVMFAAASGRQYDNLRRLFAPVAKEMAFICENGAYLRAGDWEETSTFDPGMADEIIRDILGAGMELLISTPQTSLMLKDAAPAYLNDIFFRLRNTCALIENPFTTPERDTYIKVSGFCAAGVEEIAPPLQKKWQPYVHADIAGKCWLDFTLADKGTGIVKLTEGAGVALADTAAFGDQFNDVPMLTKVGHPYLMENAPETLLRQEKDMPRCHNVMETLRQIYAALD